MSRFVLYLILLAPCFLLSAKADTEFSVSNQYSQTTNGGIGLVQTPTARFAKDGEFGFGVSSEAPWNRLYASMQFFPWMEAVLRYTEGTYLPYNLGSSQTWKDKGIDLKFRLLEEQNAGINLALGLSDIGGTGAYSSEYIVASKRFDKIDWSIGLGWGRLGGVDHFSNIFNLFGDKRETRGGYKRGGGSISLDRFFSGENTSVFSGIEYFTSIDNLSFKLEYDTTNYSRPLGRELQFDEVGDRFELDSRFNYAINYRTELSDRDKLDLSLGFVRGNTFYANFSVHSNLNYIGIPKIILGAEKIRNTNLPGGDSYGTLNKNRKKFLIDRTIREMANNGFVTHSIIFDGEELAAEISQSRFQDIPLAIDLASRVLANNSPKNIKEITIINIDNGIETLRSTVLRQDLIKSVKTGPLNQDLVVFNPSRESKENSIIIENEYLYPNFYWEIKPRLNSTLQHPIQFFFWQLEANISSVYSIKRGLYLTTEIGIDVANNFEDYTFHVADGELYHVRQDRRLYLTEGTTGLRKMSLDYFVDLHPNIKAKLSAGYLEWMYGGLGGELLYIPDNKRWALGLDTYWVKQREFEQKFAFRDYETITGFISYYQDIPFYDMRLKLSAGKFLAKDVGAMIDISRRFKNGARVGGFVGLTDCDAQCVGEGNFHKGIYFELPMDLFYIQSNTRDKTGYSWSPLTKDVAAKIDTGRLYDVVINATDEVGPLRQKSWSVKKILSGFKTQPSNRVKFSKS